jgi:hypothetical protein
MRQRDDTIYGRVYGFGSSPKKWKWDNTPREVIGEGIRAAHGAEFGDGADDVFACASFSLGDYVEIE